MTQGSGTVTFNGTSASSNVASWGNSSIDVTVPSGATTGNVVVTVDSVASNNATFTVVSGPSITSLSSGSGAVSSSVTITGTGFGSSRGSSTVTFNGTPVATYGTWSSTSIGVTVPTGATTGDIVVTVGVPSNGKSFTVTESVSSNVFYYISDQLGTARVITDSSGNVCYDADFYPFGGERPSTYGYCDSAYKFTGKDRDSESGLDYFGARHYSSQYGRFMTPDPSGLLYADLTNPQSLNLYSYALNNPLRFIDPTGLYCVDENGDDLVDDNGDQIFSGQGDCQDYGGSWITVGGQDNFQQQMTVSADDSSDQDTSSANNNGVLSTLSCAASTANKYGIAGALQATGVVKKDSLSGKVANAFLGNTFSGIYDVANHFASGFAAASNGNSQGVANATLNVYGDLALGGTAQGVLTAGTNNPAAQGLVGSLTDAAVNGTAKALTGSELLSATGTTAAEAVGYLKVGVDFAIFAVSATYCYAHN